jgi:hypothetical protein
MATGQQWLFAPTKPLVERLGQKFFRKVPTRPGVYKMHDAAGNVVYVGKAKNLRQRLRSYRVANPERVKRRHLRMMREVTRIEFELCHNESAALIHEGRLLRQLRPKYNRAGVWPGKAQFLTWRFADGVAQFSVHEIPPLGWDRFGSLGGYAPRLHGSVVRLLWLALNPQAGFSGLPHGWAKNRIALPVTLTLGEREAAIRLALKTILWGQPENFDGWVQAFIRADLTALDRAALAADLEEIEKIATNKRHDMTRSNQLALL